MSEKIKNALKCLEMDMLDNTQIELFVNYIEKLQKELEEKTTILMAGADKVKQLEKENKELNLENQALFESINCNDDNMLARRYQKLQEKNQVLEKVIDLIIDDFQMENYFVNMTNKEVREYYKKRKELKE